MATNITSTSAGINPVWRDLLGVIDTVEKYEELLFYMKREEMNYGVHIILNIFTNDLRRKYPSISQAVQNSYRKFLEQLTWDHQKENLGSLHPLTLDELESRGLDRKQYEHWYSMSKDTAGYQNAADEMWNLMKRDTNLFHPVLELLTSDVIKNNKVIEKDIERAFTMCLLRCECRNKRCRLLRTQIKVSQWLISLEN